METHTLNRVKGQSLIEVVVALGILAAVFATAATLIVTIVDLNVSARSRTEVVALAQKVLSENVKDAMTYCSTNVASKPKNCTLMPGRPDYCVTVDVRKGRYSTGSSPYVFVIDPSREDFARITVTVDWKDKTVSNSYEVSQIVRLKND